MNNKKLSGLYAITDPELMANDLVAKTEQAILGGINILQYRNKTASYEQQEKEANELAQLCRKHDVIFLINDNIELAIKTNADGVHIGQQDTRLEQARKKLGSGKIIGVTCHNQLSLAKQAEKQGADYVAFGRFFPSLTKPSAPAAELSLLKQAKQEISIPICAIGGITHELAPQVLKQGVDMLAVINGIFGQDDILNTCHDFVRIINSPATPV